MKIKETVNKVNSIIEENEHLVNFTALVVAIVALIIAIIAFISIPTVNAKPISVVDFCPSITIAGGSCDIRNTCGEKKTEFNISCLEGYDSAYYQYQIISNIYNKGSALATNIEMTIQFENNTLVMMNSDTELSEGVITIGENGATRLSRIACQDRCLFWGNEIPVLKPSDSSELKLTFERRDFKQLPKYVKFILYQDGEIKGEKTININYKQNNNSFPNLVPQQIDGIVSYKNIAANNATVFVKNMRTGEVMTTTTNELGQYLLDLSNMKSNTFYKDFISVTACFKNICSEKQIEADTVLGANEVNINIE